VPIPLHACRSILPGLEPAQRDDEATMTSMNLADLFRHETETISLASGDALFSEGDAGDLMYILRSGSADILVGGRVMETAVAGALLGEMALIDKAPRAATVIARTNCILVPIDVRRFHFLVQQTPNFATHVMRVMAQRLRRADSFVK
jgi:CRP/FNR family cyclic AMP-dependent transcriptional regulator